MTGRVRVRQADGRVATGYRKTPRIDERQTAPAEPVAHRLVFQLPTELWAVPEGPHGTQIEIGRMRNVTVKGCDRDRVLELAARFLQRHGEGHARLSAAGVMQVGHNSDIVTMALVKGNVIAFVGRVRHWVFPARR